MRRREIPERTRQPTTSSGTIPTCALVEGEQANRSATVVPASSVCHRYATLLDINTLSAACKQLKFNMYHTRQRLHTSPRGKRRKGVLESEDDFIRHKKVRASSPRSETRIEASVVGRRLASHLGEECSIPGGVAPGLSTVGIVPDDGAGRRVLSGISRFPRPCITVRLHAHLTSPSSTLKISMLSINNTIGWSLEVRQEHATRRKHYTTCVILIAPAKMPPFKPITPEIVTRQRHPCSLGHSILYVVSGCIVNLAGSDRGGLLTGGRMPGTCSAYREQDSRQLGTGLDPSCGQQRISWPFCSVLTAPALWKIDEEG
ncbi:hypothetical protein PR048_023057 [Dryococelus australis]|uniref:Uncharacterized protein n=1 Tax=Dryococelus australis TaxID=614101 RepID=A0ABQ9GSZ1_9NEOP|nr:hypothetical protein PR048_023057 [Dryococelus australis]